jgi:acyl-CoA synthetase (AMP-forming)/AMP-acid ligase II
MTTGVPEIEIEGAIFGRFREVARAHRDRPAVCERGRVVTYRELEGSADATAAVLGARLAGAPGPVVLFAETGASLLAAMLGVL